MATLDVAILGLGNPGREYQHTRHNIGYAVIDELLRRYPAGPVREKYHALVAPTRIQTTSAMLVKPLTYMNNSGETARALVQDLYLMPEQVWVVYDDFQLPFGTLRVRPKGSDGGHNGIKSIISFLGQDFPRIRLGIGRDAEAPTDRDFVLSRFRPEELETVRQMVVRAADALETALVDGISLAMSRFNGSVATS